MIAKPSARPIQRSGLLRPLQDVDMWLQQNKIINLSRAVPCLDGLVLQPGKILSYWYLIGAPSRRKGYVLGMILRNGIVQTGIGGGLCQLSNLIYWITPHTPLTVRERWRHGYDVFPDAGRTQPFGSGATCAYNHIDLQIENRTEHSFQLRLWMDKNDLHGEWRSTVPAQATYRIREDQPPHHQRMVGRPYAPQHHRPRCLYPGIRPLCPPGIPDRKPRRYDV